MSAKRLSGVLAAWRFSGSSQERHASLRFLLPPRRCSRLRLPDAPLT